MKRNVFFLFTTIAIFLFHSSLLSDEIILKNGIKLKGNFKGATEKTIKFETSGEVQQIAVSEIKSITFSSSAAQPLSGSGSAKGAAAGTAVLPAKAGSVKVIPAGTKIMIKTKEPISTAKHGKGTIVEGVLDMDLTVKGVTAAPKGTPVYGTVIESVGGRRIGNQKIIVQFNALVINGKKVPIDTDPVGAEGGRGKAARMVGAGAIFGAAGGNAGKGAAIGAGVALLAGGRHIQIPAGAKVELTLKKEVKLK